MMRADEENRTDVQLPPVAELRSSKSKAVTILYRFYIKSFFRLKKIFFLLVKMTYVKEKNKFSKIVSSCHFHKENNIYIFSPWDFTSRIKNC